MSTTYVPRPVAGILAAAACGCACGPACGALWIGPATGVGLLGLAIAAVQRKRAAGWIGLLAGAFFLFLAYASQTATPGSVAAWIPRRDVSVTGVLLQSPEPDRRGRGWISRLRCETANGPTGSTAPVSGRLSLWLPGPPPPWLPGDRVRVRGELSAIRAPTNPGETDWRALSRIRGIDGRLRGRYPGAAHCLQPGASWRLSRVGARLHAWLREGVRRSLPPSGDGLAAALVTGDRRGISPLRREHLALAGMAHILAVSGLHAGLVFGLLTALAGRLCLPRAGAWGMAMPALCGFALATGASPPVTRAVLMILAAGLANLADRRVDPPSVLCLAALVVLAWNPLWIYDAGAQLSFAAAAAIIFAWKRTAVRAAWVAGLACTAAAWLATAPLCQRTFHCLTPAGLLVNLAALPLTAAGVGTGLGAAVLVWVWPAGGEGVGWAAAGIMRALEALARWGAALPGGHWWVRDPGVGWTVAAESAVLGGLAARQPVLRWSAVVVTLLLAGISLWPSAPALPPQATRVSFLNLERGEALLVESDGDAMLVDTGTEEDFLQRVKPFLAERGVQRLSALVVTHGDEDHAGGVAACCTLFRVERIWCSDPAQCSVPLSSRRRARSVRQGDRLSLGEHLRAEALWPPKGSAAGNAGSLVLRVETPGGVLLLTGDISWDQEQQLGITGPVRVLKAAHHGSRGSTSESFLQEAGPDMVVVTPGSRNPFGFPHPETLSRIRRHAGYALNTAALGCLDLWLLPGEPVRWFRAGD